MSWMADIIPPERRGRFFSRRNVICSCSWMAVSYLTGLYLDQHKSVMDYAVVFSLFAFASLLALKFAADQPDPPLAVETKQPSLAEIWRSAAGNPAFRNFVSFQLAWNFTINLAAPFFNVYMLKDLGLDLAKVTLLTVLASLLSTISAPWWGHVLDQAGERATMLFALLGACVLGCLWPFLDASNAGWLLAFILIVGGFFNAGVNLSAFNTFLGVLPQKNKASYVALSQTLVGSLVGISPILGGWIAEGWKDVMLVIVASAALKFLTIFFIRNIQSRKPHGVAYLVQEYVLVNPFKVMSNVTLELFGGGKDGK
jgi:MFS family permease